MHCLIGYTYCNVYDELCVKKLWQVLLNVLQFWATSDEKKKGFQKEKIQFAFVTHIGKLGLSIKGPWL